jgi:hypothetical protein
MRLDAAMAANTPPSTTMGAVMMFHLMMVPKRPVKKHFCKDFSACQTEAGLIQKS